MRPLRQLSPASLTAGLAALAVMVAVSCQPKPAARDQGEPMRTTPSTVTADHHPPPRMSEP